ncbi:oxaloacetate decarboxylase [Amycolatopsis sp. GM8]|uniref:isocitrate lyase/PEP mutase family protein n=1 Tax=Amycolatopsis sp. GM8 TaxID=2896530 RepID=UPI001F302BA6|nr:isocitrate lyase/PEP mutase family protein [Amycolatopsis sp. GM8]
MTARPGAALRALLDSGTFVVAPGIYDGLSATLVERHGFAAAYVSGAAAALVNLARPDLGLLSAGDMAQHVTRLRAATSLPLIVDIDTGYGNEVNVRHAVETFERLGAAAVHIEDQEFPKRCGHLDGKSVVPADVAASKVRAAVASRTDMLVIARTDAIATLGVDEAIERGNRFADEGADLIFVEAPRTVAELERIAAEVHAPVLVNVVPQGRTPVLPLDEYRQLGFAMAILPSATLGAAAAAMGSALSSLARTGVPDAAGPGPVELFELVGLSEWLTWSGKYNPA